MTTNRRTAAVVLALCTALTACGGGGSDTEEQVQQAEACRMGLANGDRDPAPIPAGCELRDAAIDKPVERPAGV